MFLLTDEPIQWFMILQIPMDNHCREGSEVSRKKWEVLKVLKLRLFKLWESLRSLNFKTFKTFIKKITESKEGMLQFYWPKIRHDPKSLPTEKGKNQNGGTLSFLGKTVFLAKMILKVLTLRLFLGLRSLNFKTFKTLVLDQVLKVLTLRLPSCLPS